MAKTLTVEFAFEPGELVVHKAALFARRPSWREDVNPIPLMVSERFYLDSPAGNCRYYRVTAVQWDGNFQAGIMVREEELAAMPPPAPEEN